MIEGVERAIRALPAPRLYGIRIKASGGRGVGWRKGSEDEKRRKSCVQTAKRNRGEEKMVHEHGVFRLAREFGRDESTSRSSASPKCSSPIPERKLEPKTNTKGNGGG